MPLHFTKNIWTIFIKVKKTGRFCGLKKVDIFKVVNRHHWVGGMGLIGILCDLVPGKSNLKTTSAKERKKKDR